MGLKLLFLAFLSSILLSFALYANTIPGEFVYDDSIFKDRKELSDPSYLWKIWGEPLRVGDEKQGVYRPLMILSFAINFIFFGKGPASFHIFNIILNGIAVFLVYLVSWQLFKNKLLSIFTALFFAFLPIHTENVAFIKARDEILSTVFSLASISVFLKGIGEASNRRVLLIFLSSFLFFLAVMTKEFVIVLPLLILAIYWIKGKPIFRNLVRTGLIFTPITLIYLFIRWLVLGQYSFGSTQTFWFYSPMQYVDFPERIWTSFKMLFLYLQKTFFPVNLSATYHSNHLTLVSNPVTSWETILGIVILGILGWLVFWSKTRTTPVGMGVVLFFLPYLMFSKFTFAAGEIFAERWMYLPSFGLSLIAGFFLYKLFKYQKWVSILVLASILVFYTAILVPRNNVWLSERSLHESMIKDAPQSAQGYIGLAYLYYQKGDREKSTQYLKKGQQIYSDHPKLLELEAVLAYSNRDKTSAKNALDRAMEVDPSTVNYLFYAIILTEEGEYAKALEIADKYFSLPHYDPNEPQNEAFRCLMAINLIKLGRSEEAKKICDLSSKSKPQIIQP